MEIAKALILAGRARDDRPPSRAPWAANHLFPVANRPILVHNLEALRAAGLLEATIMVEPGERAAIERAVGDGSESGLGIRYADHASASGLAGALRIGRSFVGEEPVLVQDGDALLRERMYPHLAAFARENLDALALRFAHANGRSQSSSGPGYMLSARAVSILVERPDAADDPVAGVRAHGGRARVQAVDGSHPCHGGPAALLECNRRMLEGLTPSVAARALSESTIQGAVVVHPTARLQRTLVRGPAIIGPGARLVDAYVGPYTSIGADVVLEGTEIEHSIVLDGAELRFVPTRLESCVIGRDARVRRGFAMPRSMQLSLGDGAEVVV
jgi:glucose-1-phosphate thymidylyltransferase